MKIRDVRACQPPSPEAPPDWRSSLGQILVAIETTDGLVGFGVGGGGAAAFHVIRAVFRDMLAGRDVEPVEEHWERLYRASVAYGRKGLAIMALSGIDLALWDLRGKAAGKPIHELLGGARHRRMPMYASLGDDPASAVAAGFTAVKLHLPPIRSDGDRAAVVQAVREARNAIGPNVRLMADAFMNWDVETALALAGPFSELGVEWLEEPLLPDDFAGYAELARLAPIPIAGGEHEYTAAAFRELADRRLHSVLQPDVTWCGGMTELVKIYAIAAEHGLKVCPHRGAEIWALHAIAALEPIDPLPEAGRKWITWLRGQPQLDRGWITVPDGPGFGVGVDENSWRR
jgi:L-rhamnonate dehydratase